MYGNTLGNFRRGWTRNLKVEYVRRNGIFATKAGSSDKGRISGGVKIKLKSLLDVTGGHTLGYE